MTVAPTLDKGLRIDVDSATDWQVLDMICTDASLKAGSSLAESLGGFMEDDEDWAELMTPELDDQFNAQVAHVSKTISSAKKENDLTGSVSISREDADIWFGAINQARIALEERFHLSQLEEEFEDGIDPENIDDPALLAAVIRYDFYSRIQTIMLDYILD
ncbi:hypothetical protein [Rubritalea marina]|uniref:DUF2017 family protein n=1 Tax=Rubritalea marina TaxID=361055 RepID=UPI00036DF168|nr:hypothetical protein [Rubritalea marina]